MSITIGGTFSGLNVTSIISSIIAADSIPITNLQTTDTNLQNTSSDLGSLGSSLGNLSVALQGLGSNSLFTKQTAASSNAALGTATVDGSAATGTTAVNITQMATTTVLTGGSGSNPKLAASPASSASITSVLNETSVQGQYFTINGKQITLDDTDTLNDVITKINNSGGGVTASYDSGTGLVSLSGSSPVILGSGADSSDFLKQAELFNNGTNAVTSAVGLGRINATADLSTAGLGTAPTTGTFTVNGVSLSYDAGDSMQTIINKINNSGAGVAAVYDTYEDRIVLSATHRGPQNITVADGTSNIASALRLSSSDSSLSVGQPTLFTVNGSSVVRQSDSNVLQSGDLGVPGLTFTATGTGTTQVSVQPDVTNIAAAINAFVDQYNSTQNVINTYMAINTADPTKNGSLASDTNLTFLAPQLRAIVAGSTSASSVIRMLGDLGVTTNANDNTMTEVDTTKLQDALTNHLSDVQGALFNGANGLTDTVQKVISTYNDSLNGVLVTEQNSIKQQIAYNQSQITRMQEHITAEQTQLQNEFSQLDQIEAKLSNLSSIFSGSSSSSSSSSSGSSFGSVGGTTSGSSSS